MLDLATGPGYAAGPEQRAGEADAELVDAADAATGDDDAVADQDRRSDEPDQRREVRSASMPASRPRRARRSRLWTASAPQPRSPPRREAQEARGADDRRRSDGPADRSAAGFSRTIWIRAADVLGKQDLAAGTKDAFGLADRGPIVGDRAEPIGADDGVEGLIGEVKLLGIADAHVDLASKLRGALAAELGHRRAEFHPGQPWPRPGNGAGCGRSGGDLEDVAAGPGSRPTLACRQRASARSAPSCGRTSALACRRCGGLGRSRSESDRTCGAAAWVSSVRW